MTDDTRVRGPLTTEWVAYGIRDALVFGLGVALTLLLMVPFA